MSVPKWRPDNLQKHYDKRIQRDDHCWRELLNINRSMNKDEYERESYQAYNKGALEYEAEDLRHPHSLRRVDKRTVFIAASLDRKRMITCYHKHYDGRHEAGSAVSRLENVMIYIDDLDDSIDDGNLNLYRISAVSENLSGNQKKKYINPRLKILRQKCSKDR